MYEKTGIFVVATAMFLFNYGNFMKKETNSAKSNGHFFILSDKKIVYFYIFNTKQQKYNVI